MIATFLDVLDRKQNGPELTKDSWDMDYVVQPVRAHVKNYSIAYDCNVIVPNDPGLADRIFEAAFELAVSSGVFCPHTGRVIQFT